MRLRDVLPRARERLLRRTGEAPPIGGHPANEGMVRRASRTTVAICLSFPFLALDVIATSVAGSVVWWGAPLAFFSLMGVVFVGAVLAAPLQQRTEARRALDALLPDSNATARLKDLLGQSVEVGRQVVEERCTPLRDGWIRHTRSLVAAALGEGEAVATFTLKYREPKPPLRGRDRMFAGLLMRGPPPGADYVNNVQDLITRADSLPLRSGFDPDEWSVFDRKAFESANARAVVWSGEKQRSGDCPWCGSRVFDSWVTCQECGASMCGDLSFPKEEQSWSG